MPPFIGNVSRKVQGHTELTIFTTDDWDAYKNALVEVYGVEEQPKYKYKGRGRLPNPKKVPPPDLKSTAHC